MGNLLAQVSIQDFILPPELIGLDLALTYKN